MTPEQSEENRVKFMDEVRLFGDRNHIGVVAILKAHLIAEQMLNEILKCNLNWDDKKLDSCRLTFAQKTKLAIAMEGLDPIVERSFSVLNKVRNLCAHDFSFKLEKGHWESIFEPFLDEMPYVENVPKGEDQKWKRWAYWVSGVLFPTADVYASEANKAN